MFALSGGDETFFLDCSSAALLSIYRGFAKALEALQEDTFNTYFATEQVVVHPEGVQGVQPGDDERPPPGQALTEEIEINAWQDLLPGDLVYFRSYADYELTHAGTEAAWAGEHAVYMGNDLFQGFGVQPSSHAQMVAALELAYNSQGIKVEDGFVFEPKKGREPEPDDTEDETIDGLLPGMDKSIRRPKNPTLAHSGELFPP